MASPRTGPRAGGEASRRAAGSAGGSRVRTDSVRVAAGAHYQRGALHQLVWGEHYRRVWAVPVQVLRLDAAVPGGWLVPHRKGGGFQTKNLWRENPDGQQTPPRRCPKAYNGSLFGA